VASQRISYITAKHASLGKYSILNVVRTANALIVDSLFKTRAEQLEPLEEKKSGAIAGACTGS